MELTTAQQIVLIILSSALGIFILLGIVIAVMVIQLLKTVRQVADKAEKVVESAEAVGNVFRSAARPAGLLHFVQGLVTTVLEHKKSSDKK